MNILFTCAGRRNYLINYFKEALNGDGKVIAVDQSTLAPALVDADIAIEVPDIYKKKYLKTILKIAKSNSVAAIISLNDLELPILSKNKSLFEKEGIKVIVSNEMVIDIGFDKLKTFNYFNSLGLKTPKTFTKIEEAKQAIKSGALKFPVVLKPRWGSASIGIDFPETIEELELSFKLQKIKITKSILGLVSSEDIENSILIQEKVDGKEFGLDVVNDFDGMYFGTFAREKLSMRSGETDKAISVIDPRLEKLGEKLGKALKHIGNMDCDAFVTKDDVHILEINPRFGGGYPFSHEAGVNLASIYLGWLRGETNENLAKFNNYKEGIIFSKCDRLIEIGKPEDSTKNLIEEITQKEKWDELLGEIGSYDFYHTYDYHMLARKDNEIPVILKYTENDVIIALPILIREIPGTKYKDATSVYGYAGPINKGINGNFNNKHFIKSLIGYFKEKNIVSVFSRLNPFILGQDKTLINLGNLVNQGKVVNIDLKLDLDVQKQHIQKRLKTNINRLRKLCSIKKASNQEGLKQFIEIYYDNLNRVNATRFYYFNSLYFQKLLSTNDFKSEILLAVDNETGETIGGCLFVFTNSIVQYHLSGVKKAFLHKNPTKLLIDEMRIIATEKGYKYFNLGGGLGGRDNDSLFRFKSLFSSNYREFKLWELIINQEVYDELVKQNNITEGSSFFPLYRLNEKNA
ncbi:ATP-grasp domain-containing protein [Seonamhaeicola sp.]|uniref:ATP-grasp domain-containing protein n=1 Tax=Seonamhaeicola sp. TaxID=1912245 RepID=UPI002636D2D2|nr:ATP-grasp domain-containing protein [Seonamhaeicola sp.]